jgi:stress response protein YsnF
MPTPTKPQSPAQGRQTQGEKGAGARTVPVVQEELAISRVTEKTGKAVRVRIESHEERQKVPVSEMIDEVSVERVPINQYVDERTGSREEGDVVIIPVFETVSVVEQRLLLREEVRIVRRRREVRREDEVVLRKETPIIERRASNQDEWKQGPQDQ